MKQSKAIGILGTVVIHGLALLFLLLYTLTMPQQEEEGGVPVMLGDIPLGGGDSDPYTLTAVDVLSQPEPTAESSSAEPEAESPLITQQDEPSIEIKKETPKKEQTKKETAPKKVETTSKPKEKTEAEKQAEAERAAAETAANKITGAFGKGTKLANRGESSTINGNQGAPTGNSVSHKSDGVGGLGTFDLNGRSLGSEGLPKPNYNVQDEGRVVVTIVVDPQGKVISASINKRTNTVNPSLRKAAVDAAKQARFNTISGVNNQSGTITYYFKLK